MTDTQKVGVVTGVANKWSIAYGVAKAMHDAGVRVVVFTAPVLVDKAKKAMNDIDPTIEVLPMDVEGKDDDIIAAAKHVGENYGTVHYVLHAIAGVGGHKLPKDILEMSRESLASAIDISAYSFKALCEHFTPLMTDGGGITCMTFAGSQQNSPSYGMMGVAKGALESMMRYLAAYYAPKGIFINAVSAGPVKTMSLMGVADASLSLFMSMMRSLTGQPLDMFKLGRDIFRSMQMETMIGAIHHADNGVFRLVGMGSTPREMEIMQREKDRMAQGATARSE